MIIIIPLIDDYLQMYIAEKLKFLKKHPAIIDRIFYTGKRETLVSLKEFITKKPIKVVLGYPRDPASLPCYVITLAPEQEIPLGLGDGTDEFMDYEGELGDEPSIEESAINSLSVFLNGTYMNSNYRVECWSDNGDLSTYMYVILKWCLYTSRSQMLNDGWVNIKLSGTDLEPVPDYMPVFIYRRSLQINLQYENLYFKDLPSIEVIADVIEHPDNYHFDEDGNIRNNDEEIVLINKYTWVIKPHFYTVKQEIEE